MVATLGIDMTTMIGDEDRANGVRNEAEVEEAGEMLEKRSAIPASVTKATVVAISVSCHNRAITTTPARSFLCPSEGISVCHALKLHRVCRVDRRRPQAALPRRFHGLPPNPSAALCLPAERQRDASGAPICRPLLRVLRCRSSQPPLIPPSSLASTAAATALVSSVSVGTGRQGEV
jgi:hypothetical protein